MKISRAVFIFCLLISLSNESVDQELNSINDLKKIIFERSVPKHTLLLLHWFANTVDINNNDVVSLTFNPNNDFGSHHYGNYEDMLDPLPRGYRYYTVGNLNQDTSDELPDYVLNPPMREYEGTNMDRIIFRVREQHSGVHRVDQVYITQHDSPWTWYDPDHTYQISTSLLRQIRLFSVENQRSLSNLRNQFHSSADDYQLRDIIKTWGYNLACVGLMLFIVIQDSKNRLSNKHQESENRPQPEDREDDQLHFESDTSNDWKETCHLNPLEQNDREELDLENHNTRDQPELDGSVVPLVKDYTDQNDWWLETINRWPEEINQWLEAINQWLEAINRWLEAINRWLEEYIIGKAELILLFVVLLFVSLIANFKPPGHNILQHPAGVTITGYDANLELFVRKDKTCARLYVNHYFTAWRSKFYWSWVGFYKSAEKDTNQYEGGQWQWAVKFEPCFVSLNVKYSCFEYCSEMVAAPGVQVRFILRQNLEIAHAQQPEGVELTGYNAHLQLFVRDGKACARLYVKKSFTEWSSEFKQSWVGFYKSAEKDTHEYEIWKWQWATKFKQCPDSDKYREYDIFEYCSDLTYARGVQVRFIHRGRTEIARHPRW